MGTIGAVSDLVEKKLKQWRAETIRHLVNMEQVAKEMRDELEDDPRLDAPDPTGVDTLIYLTSSITTLADRITGFREAGL